MASEIQGHRFICVLFKPSSDLVCELIQPYINTSLIRDTPPFVHFIPIERKTYFPSYTKQNHNTIDVALMESVHSFGKVSYVNLKTTSFYIQTVIDTDKVFDYVNSVVDEAIQKNVRQQQKIEHVRTNPYIEQKEQRASFLGISNNETVSNNNEIDHFERLINAPKVNVQQDFEAARRAHSKNRNSMFTQLATQNNSTLTTNENSQEDHPMSSQFSNEQDEPIDNFSFQSTRNSNGGSIWDPV